VIGMNSVCELCQKSADLQLSHVLPAFLFRWLKKSGPIRYAGAPNRRVQDGHKSEWLCRECEALFNLFETPFANQIFHPLDNDDTLRIRYGEWMLKFCVSVSWRSLLYMRKGSPIFPHFSEQQNARADEALRVWGEFLLGERAHPGRFEQHVLAFSPIEDAGGADLPPNINRYLIRTIDIDAGASASASFVYSKLGPIAIFGFIDVSKPRDWVGTKIAVNSGLIGPGNFTLSNYLWKYLMDRARRVQDATATISPVQQQKVNESVLANPDKFLASGVYRAMQRDIEMFGDAAFTKFDDPEKENQR
jgi:hypothetical protein